MDFVINIMSRWWNPRVKSSGDLRHDLQLRDAALLYTHLSFSFIHHLASISHCSIKRKSKGEAADIRTIYPILYGSFH